MHLSPSEYLILLAGGIRPLARLVGREASNVYKWKKYTNKSGETGCVPQQLHKKLLLIAKEKSWDLTLEDLLNGKTLQK